MEIVTRYLTLWCVMIQVSWIALPRLDHHPNPVSVGGGTARSAARVSSNDGSAARKCGSGSPSMTSPFAHSEMA